ncbi:MAG: hypothetical protein JHC31_01445 [Sulfurihydrogenibium sp.]|nr:hypothetical protein [Sulfurihydrogenibium sp.]
MEAKLLRSSYLNIWKMENNQRIIKGKYVPRLTEKSGTVYIEWISFNKRNRSVHLSFDKRQKIYGDYIKKSKKGGYNKTAFKYASDWELSLIMEYEEKFNKIRTTLELLKKSLFYLRASIKRLNPETEE